MEFLDFSQARLTEPVLRAYRGFVAAVDINDCQTNMGDAISSLAKIDRFYVSERSNTWFCPKLIAHRTENSIRGRMGDYFERFFRTDPVICAMEKTRENGNTAVLRVAPEDIDHLEYREQFFSQANVVERISFVQRSEDRWLIMNVARRAPLPRFSAAEVNELAVLSQLLLPLATHNACVTQDGAQKAALSIQDLETRFLQQFPSLTPRERQVCARTVIGMTAEATALDLDIGIGSVQTYRKRAFHRLQICSAFQLAPLIMH